MIEANKLNFPNQIINTDLSDFPLMELPKELRHKIFLISKKMQDYFLLNKECSKAAKDLKGVLSQNPNDSETIYYVELFLKTHPNCRIEDIIPPAKLLFPPLKQCPELLLKIKETKDIKNFLILVKNGTLDPSQDCHAPFLFACQMNLAETVKEFLKDPRVDPACSTSAAIRTASADGFRKLVKILLKDKRSDPSADSNYALRIASQKGYTKIVEDLLNDPRVSIHDYNYAAERFAKHFDNQEIVKILQNRRYASLKDPLQNS